jgi:hypothetical protein
MLQALFDCLVVGALAAGKVAWMHSLRAQGKISSRLLKNRVEATIAGLV